MWLQEENENEDTDRALYEERIRDLESQLNIATEKLTAAEDSLQSPTKVSWLLSDYY